MPQRESLKTLIPLERLSDRPVRRGIMTGFNGLLERVLSVDKIRSIYDTIPECSDPFQFLKYTLDRLHIDHALDEEGRRAIPLSGPAIVVSNHPFGGIDGMILASALSSVRRDIKILVNYFLESIEELNPLFFPVDPFNRKGSASRNMGAIRKAIHWVKAGGLLVVLPAGEVSHFSFKRRKIEDPAWNVTVGRLVQLTKAPVLPVYFRGRNSALFQIAGLAHPRLRTAMLPRETLKKGGSLVEFKIGRAIPFKSLSRFQDATRLTEYLSFRTYLLGTAEEKERSEAHAKGRPIRLRKMDPIARPVDPGLVAKEVNDLPPDQQLLTSSNFSVYYARSSQIPLTLHEIGRLREETFRTIGEGTGNAIDLDRFDNIYIHLFVWNNQQEELVGAYRLGPTAEILPRHGKKGLYTYTLFNYQSRLLDKIGPALELGRTFVRSDYQRDYSPLLLLWKGIGQYIALHPSYKTLFGAVSMSNDYRHFSRQLLAAFLRVTNFSSDLSRMIRPRRPLGRNRAISLIHEKEDLHQNDLNEISSWISDIEDDGKGVPILLKQYLKLGGKVLCFNVDGKFGDTLDGLIVVDLTQTDHKVLKRYLGEEGLQKFSDYHASTTLDPLVIKSRPFPSYADPFERKSLKRAGQGLL
ncbi:MAG: lysophospholipid acyltransferase family protein [Deltaproteobacteria bacterium]|nr:lysophospholipid acyltransferase family protein [Deltaproteobacteria bacterium]